MYIPNKKTIVAFVVGFSLLFSSCTVDSNNIEMVENIQSNAMKILTEEYAYRDPTITDFKPEGKVGINGNHPMILVSYNDSIRTETVISLPEEIGSRRIVGYELHDMQSGLIHMEVYVDAFLSEPYSIIYNISTNDYTNLDSARTTDIELSKSYTDIKILKNGYLAARDRYRYVSVLDYLGNDIQLEFDYGTIVGNTSLQYIPLNVEFSQSEQRYYVLYSQSRFAGVEFNSSDLYIVEKEDYPFDDYELMDITKCLAGIASFDINGKSIDTFELSGLYYAGVNDEHAQGDLEWWPEYIRFKNVYTYLSSDETHLNAFALRDEETVMNPEMSDFILARNSSDICGVLRAVDIDLSNKSYSFIPIAEFEEKLSGEKTPEFIERDTLKANGYECVATCQNIDGTWNAIFVPSDCIGDRVVTDGQNITIYDQINEHITIPGSMDSSSFEILNGNYRIIWNANADVLIYSPESHRPIKLDIRDALYESVMDEKRYGDVDYYPSSIRGMFNDLFFYQTDSKLYFAYDAENASDISTTCVICVDLSTYEISNVKAYYNVGLLDAAFNADTVTLVMMDNPLAGNTPYFTLKLSTSSFDEIE